MFRQHVRLAWWSGRWISTAGAGIAASETRANEVHIQRGSLLPEQSHKWNIEDGAVT